MAPAPFRLMPLIGIPMRNLGTALGSVGATVALLMGTIEVKAEDRMIIDLYACKGIVDNEARLACLDRVLASIDQVQSFGQTSTAPALDALSAEAGEIERNSDGNAIAISASIKGWSIDGSGRTVVELDNGQRWRQVEAVAMPLASERLGPYRVRIARGALGSFNLTIDGLNKTYKVRRVDRWAKS